MENFLKSACNNINIPIDNKAIERLLEYSRLLRLWNEKINLTAITDEKEIIIKHFIDSLSILNYMDIDKNSSVIDVGTGAGFPGLPIKIIREDINLTLLDSLNKRINFLDEVVKSLDLKDVNLIHGRAEELSHKAEYREAFDYSISRAVASLNILAEFCLPYIRVGGYFGALKGPNGYNELKESKERIESLGGSVIDIKNVAIPNSDLNHTLIIIKKISKTPNRFPRKLNAIKK